MAVPFEPTARGVVVIALPRLSNMRLTITTAVLVLRSRTHEVPTVDCGMFTAKLKYATSPKARSGAVGEIKSNPVSASDVCTMVAASVGSKYVAVTVPDVAVTRFA